MKTHYKPDRLVIFCACGEVEHQLIFQIDDLTCGVSNDKYEKIVKENDISDLVEMNCCVALNQPASFFQRIVIAIKYIFGYKSRYGHFDSFCIDMENTNKLIEFCGKHKKLYEYFKDYKSNLN